MICSYSNEIREGKAENAVKKGLHKLRGERQRPVCIRYYRQTRFSYSLLRVIPTGEIEMPEALARGVSSKGITS